MSVCLHERIQCVNCVKSCLICGAKLPADFIPGKPTPAPVKAAETPENEPKTAKKTTRKKVTK